MLICVAITASSNNKWVKSHRLTDRPAKCMAGMSSPSRCLWWQFNYISTDKEKWPMPFVLVDPDRVCPVSVHERFSAFTCGLRSRWIRNKQPTRMNLITAFVIRSGVVEPATRKQNFSSTRSSVAKLTHCLTDCYNWRRFRIDSQAWNHLRAPIRCG